MGVCYITRREQREEVSEQLGIYCAGNDARPFGEVEIPSKVMTLATRVFQNDEYVTKINLPPLLQEIQERAFENCVHLKEIVFPKTLQTINKYAFNGCNELSVIAIPDNIPLLKPYTFGGNNVKDLTLSPSFSPKLWDYAYADNHSIKSVTLNCYSVSRGCFSGSDISTLVIKDNVRILKERAFENCKQLTTIVLGDDQQGVDLTEIGDYCFYNTNLSEITIPNTIQRIGIYCFGVNDEKLPGLKKVTFQDGLKVISQYSFYGTALESVFIPKTIESIGKYAFGECNSLLEIQLEPGIQQLGIFEGYAFAKSGIEKIFIPSSVQKITKDCFNNCSKLRTAEFEAPIAKEKLEEGIFRYCKSLNDVILPKDMVYLGQNMFEGCTSLESITLPDTIEELDDYCFKGCTNLKTLDIPESIQRIGKYCFQDTYISKIKLPRTLTEIEGYAFSGCDSLGTIEFDYFNEIKEIPIDQGLQIIRANAFSNSKVGNLSIPYTIQTIERDAFRGMNVDTLHIDVIKTQDWLDASKTWGMTYKTLKWRQSILYFDSNETFFELFVSQNNSPSRVKVDTSKSEYIFEPYNDGITLHYYAYAPNKAPIIDQQFFNRIDRENERSFIFEEQAPFKIEFIVRDENGEIINDAQISADTLFNDFKYTYNTQIFYLNQNTDIISYKIVRSGYETIYGNLYNIQKDEIIDVTLSRNGFSYIKLCYPFKENTEFLTNLLDNIHYKITDCVLPWCANTLQSLHMYPSNNEVKVNAAYIKFKTPNDLHFETTITITGVGSYSSYGHTIKAVLGLTPYYKDKSSGGIESLPNNWSDGSFSPIGEFYSSSYEYNAPFTLQKTFTSLSPNTYYYISIGNDYRWFATSDNDVFFLKEISFYSCPIEDPSLELPTIISGDKVCLYDGIGKTEPFINSEFFGFQPENNNIIFEDLFNIDLAYSVYVDSMKDAQSNCYGNRLCKACSINDANTGFFDAGIFKLVKSINCTDYSKIKITCVITHDYPSPLISGAYMYVGKQEDIAQPIAQQAYNWGQWASIGEMSASGQHALFTCTYDVSQLQDEQDLFIGVYHGTATKSYTVQCYVTEIELQ